ncbi:MAG: A24 family peptidase [Minicystis sp.]
MIGQPYFLIAAVLVAAVAAWFDWRTGEMPNAVTLVPLALAPLAHGIVAAIGGGFQAAVQAAGFSVLGAAVCVLVPVALYRAGAIGGGDVKLFAALGALMRTLIGVEAQFYACLAACIIALGQLAYHGKLLRVLGNTFALAVNPLLPKEKRREIPPEQLTWARFGPAIFVGTAVTAVLHWRQP